MPEQKRSVDFDPQQDVACRLSIDEDEGSTDLREASPSGAELFYLQHQLAAKVPALADALRFGRFAQGKYTRLRRAHGARCMQMQNSFKMRTVAADGRTQRLNIGAWRNRRLRS